MNKYKDFSIRQVLYNKSHTTKNLSPETSESINRFPNLKLTQRINYSSTPTFPVSPLLTSTSFEVSPNIFSIRTPDPSPENNLAETSFKPFLTSISIKLPNIEPKVSRKNDFNSILDQIETVVSPKLKKNSFVLREDEPICRNLTSKRPDFYKIFTKGKKTPLSVRIKEYESRIIVYMSYSDPQPRQSSNNRVYLKSYIEISDQAFEFKSDIVYLGVYSEKDCKYKIQIHFGKIRSLNELRSAKLTHRPLDSDPDFTEEKPDENKTFLKDFIKANKDVQYQLSISKLRDLRTEQEMWSKRRTEILNKKKSLVLQKKNKTIESLNRRTKRLELEEKERVEQELRNSLNKSKSFLLVVVYLLKSTENMNKVMKERREFVLTRIKKNIKARTLQRFIKKKVILAEHVSVKSVAKCCFFIFQGVFKEYSKTLSERKILKAVTDTAKSNIMLKQLSELRQKLLKIQRAFRRHLSVKKFRMKKLYKLWKSCVDKMVHDKHDTKTAKNKANKYKTIPHSSKKRFLGNYYQSCWVAFRAKIRDFYLKKGEVGPVPRLVYIPSEVKMMEMINNLL